MEEKASVQGARRGSRFELFQRTGWVFVTADIFPQLEEIGVLQRFQSLRGEFVHEVRADDGVYCTCPGWRKYAKCWHVRWVLAWNVGQGWTLGTYLKSMPAPYERATMDEEGGWTGWLDENIAVVEPDSGPTARQSISRRIPPTPSSSARTGDWAFRPFAHDTTRIP